MFDCSNNKGSGQIIPGLNHDNNAGSSCNIEEKRIRIIQNRPGGRQIFMREKD